MAKKKTNKRKPKKPVFLIYVAGERFSYVLQDLREEKFQSMQCIVGVFAKPDVEWVFGTTVRIPRDKITVIAEFESIEDYTKRLKTVDRE